MLTLARSYLDALLADLKAVAGLAVAVKVHLFTGTPPISGGMVIGDFTEATFDGYAASAVITWSDPLNPEDNDGKEMVGDTKSFICTGTTTPEVITGYFLTGTGDVIMGAEMFETPQAVNAVDDAVVVVPRLTFNSSPYGSAVVVN